MENNQEKKLGKIEKVSFGLGGYQEAMLGLSLTFYSEKDHWGVADFKGTWDYNIIEVTETTKWTEEDRSLLNIEMLKLISDLLKDAKVNSVDQLKGKPVECTFEGNKLVSWRILKEVI